MKHIHFPLILLTIMLACNLFTACNDDEGGGIPVIHHIRLTDPEKADSTFTDVNPGTMIVAIGENLNGVKKVFINQQEVSFNSNYSTSTNLILTIPADLPLVGANPDLKDELRIETTHGTAIYSMHVLSPAPYITRIATTFPVEVGTPLRVIGGNFYEIQRIYFTTAEGDITDAPVSTEITEFTVNKDFSEISFKAPAGLIDEGSLVVECYTAAAFTPFRRTALPPSINKVSSMMPITGTTVTVLGQNRLHHNGQPLRRPLYCYYKRSQRCAYLHHAAPTTRHLLTRHHHNGRHCRSSGLLSSGEYRAQLR